MDIRRGQIWWWNCPTHNREHIQAGVRPVVVVSNDVCNSMSSVLTVLPVTSSVSRAYPQQVPVVFDHSVSIVLGDQITSIPKSELNQYICTLHDYQMEQIDKILKVQLGLIPLGHREEE